MSALASAASAGPSGDVRIAPLSLRALLDHCRAEGRRLSLEDAIAIVVPVCVDLKARHDRGETYYVHPSAITQHPDGVMRLAPALAVPPPDHRDRAAMAPEVLRTGAPGNSRASVFAVGAILYEALTGTPVGPAMRRPREVEPSLPEALEHLLAKALVGDPAHRPDDLGALASALHHLAPMRSVPPPAADVSRLDRGDGVDVDVKLSLLPPEPPPGAAPPPPSLPGAKDPTRHLASLKARLESDPRPRYVVNKDRMDHGPFNAVELLQQIASHQFRGQDGLRDELTGVSQTIDDWEEFAPFAEHARMHRDIAQEKRDVARVEKAEKKAGAAKFIIGGILAATILAVGVTFLIKKVGARKDGGDFGDDPSAIDLSGGGSLKGNAKAKSAAGGKGGAGAGGGNFVPSGMSYEAALASNNQEINMGAKGGPDLTNAQLEAPMKNASFISSCGAPDDMKVTIRVAIRMGRAVGVSVYTTPANGAVASCVDRFVRGLSWPANPKMDSFTTTY